MSLLLLYRPRRRRGDTHDGHLPKWPETSPLLELARDQETVIEDAKPTAAKIAASAMEAHEVIDGARKKLEDLSKRLSGIEDALQRQAAIDMLAQLKAELERLKRLNDDEEMLLLCLLS